MQYTQINEWRGHVFITLCSLLLVYIFSYIETNKEKLKKEHQLVFIFIILFINIFSINIWNAGFVVPLLSLFLFISYFFTNFIEQKIKIYKILSLLTFALSIVLFIFYREIEEFFCIFLNPYGIWCNNNPIQIGEAYTLSPSYGLYYISLMLSFSSFTIFILLEKDNLAINKKEYKYFLLNTFFAMLFYLPLSIVYIRLISFVAPFLTILFALSLICLFNYFYKINYLVLFLNSLLLFISAFTSQYLYFQSTLSLYNFSNPNGLREISQYITKNSSVLTWFGYGGWLEAYGNVKVYVDTIQGQNFTKIKQITDLFTSNSSNFCNLLSEVNPKPNYILIGGPLKYTILLYNVSNNTFLKNPKLFDGYCGYKIISNQSSFYLFKKGEGG
ncbi:MAG: hypothetical protein ACP5HJ_01745 [Candidatus Micrarchaeia archaeon]